MNLPADRCLNAAYALMVEGADPESRAEFDALLDGEPVGGRRRGSSATRLDGEGMDRFERSRMEFVLAAGGG